MKHHGYQYKLITKYSDLIGKTILDVVHVPTFQGCLTYIITSATIFIIDSKHHDVDIDLTTYYRNGYSVYHPEFEQITNISLDQLI